MGFGYDAIGLNISVSGNARVGINYNVFDWGDYYWYDASRLTNIVGDDGGAWFELGLNFFFYGVKYRRVWVCSNGFLCFDSEATDPNPQAIPNSAAPNTIIAPFWRDLNPAAGGIIKYDYIDGDKFVVSWIDVPDKNGIPQTFQVVLHAPTPEGSYCKIYFQYKSITNNLYTVVGVENQLGDKAKAYGYNSIKNGSRLTFETWTNYRIKYLKIRMAKEEDSYAKIEPQPLEIGGYNVILDNPENNPFGGLFVDAIGFVATLLLGEEGVFFEAFLIMAENAITLSSNLSPSPYFEIKNANTDESEAYVYAEAALEGYSCKPVDSTLSAVVYWKLTDNNDRNHSLTITAELGYSYPSGADFHVISTSVSLNMYTGYHYLDISTTSGGTTSPSPGTYIYAHNEYVTVTAVPNPGFYFECWIVDGIDTYPWSTITIQMNTDRSLRAKFYTYGGEPCPTLFVWDGTVWIDYGVIDIHNPTGEDVVREVQILRDDVGVNNYMAKFKLREGWEGLNYSESVIDQVKLYAIIDGKRYFCPLIKATHSTIGNVWPQLMLSDDYKVQMLLLETINLTFFMPYPTSQIQAYIFTIEGCNMLKQ